MHASGALHTAPPVAQCRPIAARSFAHGALLGGPCSVALQRRRRPRSHRPRVPSCDAAPGAAAPAPLPPPLPPPAPGSPRKRLAVFVSGGGSNLRALHAATLDGRVRGDVVAVVTNAPACGGAEWARAAGLPVLVHPPPKADPGAGLGPAQLVGALRRDLAVDFCLLAGYLKLVPAELVAAFPRAMLNIHPALLPAFGGRGLYGARVHAAVVASGARFSGATVHFLDEDYDTGPILAQAVVPVLPGDGPAQLAARVLAQEHALYARCAAALCEGRVGWRADGVPFVWEAV